MEPRTWTQQSPGFALSVAPIAPTTTATTPAFLVAIAPEAPSSEVAVIDVSPYERALKLMALSRQSVAQVTRRKGPEAEISPFIQGCDQHEGLMAATALGIVGAFGTGFMAGVAAINGDISAAKTLAAAALPLAAGAWACFSARERGGRLRARHANERFAQADIDTMTASWRAAAEPDRALVAGYLRARLQKVDHAMNPAAADYRDRLLATSASSDTPLRARASAIAEAVGMLLEGEHEAYRHRKTIDDTLAAASPIECNAIAAAAMPILFDEHGEARFRGSEREVRAIYTALKNATLSSSTVAPLENVA